MGRATKNRIKGYQSRAYFNPRPPWGGRPGFHLSCSALSDFNPRPPWGGRPLYKRRLQYACPFQSTPSVGRATAIIRGIIATMSDFNPRPPWGGRPYPELESQSTSFIFQSTPSVGRATRSRIKAHKVLIFQSTPSVGRATFLTSRAALGGVISIHALRGEGDRRCQSVFDSQQRFQSTPSVGRATRKHIDD